MIAIGIFLAAVLCVTAAFPTNNSAGVDAGCTITNYGEIASITSSTCTTIQINSLSVPAGSALILNLKTGVNVNIAGTITFQYKEWVGPLMEVSGSRVTITGAQGSKLDGLGAKYWDGKGDGGKVKPKFIRVKTTGGSHFNNVDLLNCPHQCWSIDSSASDTALNGCDIDISSGDSLGKNTDGFDISASRINISNSNVHNQDDCVAINKGSTIKITGLTCIGGHGLSLSVGSKAAAASVKDVTFSNCHVQNSRNGIHVKTHADAPSGGSVSNVLYSNITMSGITNYGINVQQDYAEGKSNGTAKSNVPISGLTMRTVTGTMSGSNSIPVYILCGSTGCSNFIWSGVSITGGKISSKCNFHPSGFTCPA